MALTYTPAGEIGSPCPDFTLPGVDGKTYALQKDFAKAEALVIMFICGHCPYVQAVEKRLIDLGAEFQKRGAAVVGICSNDPSDYPEDSAASLKQRWLEKHYTFPYLIDDSQSVAKAFGAVCTPDLYLFDRERKLRYRGRLDDSWRDPSKVRRRELAEAITAVLENRAVEPLQNPAMGCSIKWK